MLKSFALENFWAPSFFKPKTKRIAGYQEPTKIGFVISSVLVGVNVILLMSYIYGVNEYANKGYEIKALQTRLASLNQEIKKTNLKVSQASSMVSIQTDFLNANFVAVGTPKFLQATQLTQR